MVAFAVGDIFGGGSFNIINFLYPGYLALAVGLPAHLSGLIILIARIFDAVSDPVMGFLSDRMRVRFGSRRGALLVSAPLVVLSLFLMFYPYSNPSLTVRFWQVLASYIFFYAVQTSIMIPYFSLGSEMTTDYTERARMTSVRLGCSIFSSIVCVAVPGMIVNGYPGNQGYIVMSLAFGALFMVCVGVTGLFAKEGIPAPKKAEPFDFRDFIRPFQVKPFRQYLWLFLCCQMTMAVLSALFFFYVDFYFCRDLTARGEENVAGLAGAAIMFGMQIVALPVYMALIKKIGKGAVYIIGSAIWIAGALLLFVLPAGASPALLYLLAGLIGFGISGPGLIPHAMFGDVVDVGHLQFGARTAGAFSGIANLVNKVAQAAGLALVMAGIGAAGFIEQDISEGAAKVTSQSASAQNAIVWIMALAPLVFMSAGIFVCTRYKLNKETHQRVLTAIEGSDADRQDVLRSL
jgi:oligogalacturonide transporter